MSVTIPTTDGPMTFEEADVRTIEKRHPDVDVARRLEEYAEWLAKDSSRVKSCADTVRAIEGWLSRKKRAPVTPLGPKPVTPERVQRALEECLRRGLVPDGFQPQGATEQEQLSSLAARATVTWHQRHPEPVDDYVPRSERKLWDDQEPQLQIPA